MLLHQPFSPFNSFVARNLFLLPEFESDVARVETDRRQSRLLRKAEISLEMEQDNFFEPESGLRL